MNGPWLAIDTATDIASVAIGPRGEVRAARSVRGARQHAAQLVPLIQEVLSVSATRIDELAGIVVADGPGSFTGLRIGWAAAKGLAHERDLPLLAVASLMGAAHAAAQGDSGPVAACFDALRGQVFGAIYAFSAGRVDVLVAPALFTLPALARVAPVRPVLAVGDGAQRFADDVVAWIGRPPVALETVAPVAGSLLALLEHAGAARALGNDVSAEPVYGRPAEAQVKWEAQYGRPLPHSSR